MHQDHGNSQWWSDYFRRVAIPQLELVARVACDRILPAFDGIDDEAEREAESFWNSAMERSNPYDLDPASLAESAQEHGFDHFEALWSMRQASLNIYAVLLHHLFEQHLLIYHRREVLSPQEQDKHRLLKMSAFKKRVKSRFGIDITGLPSWPVVDELRLVANTVKHAEGGSAAELEKRRAELFIDLRASSIPTGSFLGIRHVYVPAGGKDIFVREDHLLEYCRATVSFVGEYFDSFGSAA